MSVSPMFADYFDYSIYVPWTSPQTNVLADVTSRKAAKPMKLSGIINLLKRDIFLISSGKNLVIQSYVHPQLYTGNYGPVK